MILFLFVPGFSVECFISLTILRALILQIINNLFHFYDTNTCFLYTGKAYNTILIWTQAITTPLK